MEIKGTTLYVETDSGNIGHAFNDHLYSSFAYFLAHESEIDNIYIEAEFKTDILVKHLKENRLMTGSKKAELNGNMLILFFYKSTKSIYYYQKNKVPIPFTFENIVKPTKDRFFEVYKNYIQVFSHLLKQYSQYKLDNNIEDIRYDVTVLYRSNEKYGRNIYNINVIEQIFKDKHLRYKLIELDTIHYYTFLEIVQAFNSSDNIISFHGCELTYGIFMEKNTTIIELTPINYIEPWWNRMGSRYTQFGIVYKRQHVELQDGNLYLDTHICNRLFNLLTIKYYDNFFSIGERCCNAIALYNISYKKQSGPFDYIISTLKGVNDIMFKYNRFDEIIDNSIENKTPNNAIRFGFNHHNKQPAESVEIYKNRIKTEFNKKLKFLMDCIINNKRILFIYTYKGDFKALDELKLFHEKLTTQLMYNNFKILVITKEKCVCDPFLCIQYTIDIEKHIGYNGTDYADIKLRQFIGNYLRSNFYTTIEKNSRGVSTLDCYTNIVPLGSRCINAGILAKYNYRKFSNIFDWINIKYLRNTYTSVESGFSILLDKKRLSRVSFKTEYKTQHNEFDTPTDLTFPHSDMFNDKIYESFLYKKTRFMRLKYFNNIFVYTVTYNEKSTDLMYWAKNLKQFLDRNSYTNYILLIIVLTRDDISIERYRLTDRYDNIHIYNLLHYSDSYTGGAFLRSEDNDSFINIIDIFNKKNAVFVSKEEIDNIII